MGLASGFLLASMKPIKSDLRNNYDKSLSGIVVRFVRTWWSYFVLITILGLPSLWFILRVPPLWNYMDGFLQVSTKPSAANLLVWPPLYCFGARVPMLIGYLLGGGQAKIALRYFNHPVLTDSAIYVLIIAQHLGLLLASLFFIHVLSKRTPVRIVLALAFASFSFQYAAVHTVGSESVSVILILLIVAFSVEIARRGQLSTKGWIWLTGLLCAAVLTRHINGVVTLLPIGTSCISLFCSYANGRRDHSEWVSRLLPALGAAVTAAVFANGFIWLSCLRAKVDYRSMVGETFLARLDQMRAVPGRFHEFVEQMSDRLSDPVLAESLKRLAQANESQTITSDFITEGKRTVEEALIARGLASSPKHVDEELNTLTKLTLLTEPASFRQAVWNDWSDGHRWLCGLFARCLVAGTGIDWDHDSLAGKMQPLRRLQTFSGFNFAELKTLSMNFPEVFLADKIIIWQLVLIGCCLSIVCLISRLPIGVPLTGILILVVAELLYCLTVSIAGQVCRYGITFLELVLCAVLTQAAAILDLCLNWLNVRIAGLGNNTRW